MPHVKASAGDQPDLADLNRRIPRWLSQSTDAFRTPDGNEIKKRLNWLTFV
jgi:hypothetical protein